jgi:cell division transport system permease protein
MHKLLNQHIQALKQVLNLFGQHKVGTLLICLVIATALTIPSVIYQVTTSLQDLMGNVKRESTISLFLSASTDEGNVAQIKSALEKNTDLKSVQFISKEDAFNSIASKGIQQEVLNALEKNPLPDAFIVEPISFESVHIEHLKNKLSSIEGVEEVLVDSAWIQRLNYLLALGNKAILILVCLLSFALITIIGNTIRMQILSQQAEIELSYLIGATKYFIRRPFLYAGAIYGLLGGLIALGLTSFVIWIFNRSVLRLAAEYQTDFSLNQPSVITAISLCTLSLIIGIISAYFAVSKNHLKQA